MPNGKIMLLILVLAATLRLWGAFDIAEHTDDEYVNVPSAISLFTYGTVEELQWVHPPLSSIILYGTISLFGDNPVGWRIGNIVFGTASVLLLYLIATILYPGTIAPIVAASLLAFDPFHVDFSRNTFIEVPTVFLFLAFMYFMLEFSENRRKTLLYAGIAMGLTIATKAYYLFTIPVVIAYALYRAYQRGECNTALIVDFVVALLVLPLCIYFLTFIHWFGRGYTFQDFVAMKYDAVWTVKKITLEYFHAKKELIASGKPWQWFTAPIMYGFKTFSEGDKARYLLEINNFPFRMMVIPAMVAVSMHAWRKRLSHELLIPVLFVVCYSLYLVVDRPVFSSNANVLLPFAYLALAKAVVLFARWVNREQQVYIVFLSAVLCWGLYTFPLVTGRLVPVSLYKPIIAVTNIMTPTEKGHQ